LDLHPDIRIQKLTIGAERAPLLIVDNFVAGADELVASAALKPFATKASFFPGIRVKAPLSYQQLFASQLKSTLCDYFQLEGAVVRFSMCHYSLVTTPVAKLVMLQCIPHVDSVDREGLATIHYLFKRNHGGTAFYRHRKTGFEFIDESRQQTYLECVRHELAGPDRPAQEYINGDTPLFEQIAAADGVFNRLLVYRRNSLHTGRIARDFVPDANPLTGRLSINCFLDVVQ
jgi:hypothetical protein